MQCPENNVVWVVSRGFRPRFRTLCVTVEHNRATELLNCNDISHFQNRYVFNLIPSKGIYYYISYYSYSISYNSYSYSKAKYHFEIAWIFQSARAFKLIYVCMFSLNLCTGRAREINTGKTDSSRRNGRRWGLALEDELYHCGEGRPYANCNNGTKAGSHAKSGTTSP